jgi:hypothetical protein
MYALCHPRRRDTLEPPVSGAAAGAVKTHNMKTAPLRQSQVLSRTMTIFQGFRDEKDCIVQALRQPRTVSLRCC